MSFTNLETVRLHLQESGSLRELIRDVPLRFAGVNPVALVHSNLLAGSVVVKGKELGAPRAIGVTLDSQPASLGATQVIPDSVVVARDSSLGEIYAENVDYHVDYASGQLSRIASGKIDPGAIVTAWFYAYRIHVEGVDYQVDYARGTIRRLSGSSVEDGQTVFVDYETRGAILDDTQITNAILEADDRVLTLIDAAFHESNDQALITAETYLALSILARIKAAAALRGDSSGAAAAAKSWSDLAARYEADALAMLVRYAPHRGSLSSPVGVVGGEE